MSYKMRVEDIKENICDNYCKYPEQYQMKNEDSEEAYEQMLRDRYEECPLNRL